MKSTWLLLLFFIFSANYIKASQLNEVVAASILNSELGDIDQLRDLMEKISGETDKNTLGGLKDELSSINLSGDESQMNLFYEAILDSQLEKKSSNPVKLTREKFDSILKSRILKHLITNEDSENKNLAILLNIVFQTSNLLEKKLQAQKNITEDKTSANKDPDKIQNLMEQSRELALIIQNKPLKYPLSIVEDSIKLYNMLEELITELRTSEFNIFMRLLPRHSPSQPDKVEQEQLLKLKTLSTALSILCEDL